MQDIFLKTRLLHQSHINRAISLRVISSRHCQQRYEILCQVAQQGIFIAQINDTSRKTQFLLHKTRHAVLPAGRSTSRASQIAHAADIIGAMHLDDLKPEFILLEKWLHSSIKPTLVNNSRMFRNITLLWRNMDSCSYTAGLKLTSFTSLQIRATNVRWRYVSGDIIKNNIPAAVVSLRPRFSLVERSREPGTLTMRNDYTFTRPILHIASQRSYQSMRAVLTCSRLKHRVDWENAVGVLSSTCELKRNFFYISCHHVLSNERTTATINKISNIKKLANLAFAIKDNVRT